MRCTRLGQHRASLPGWEGATVPPPAPSFCSLSCRQGEAAATLGQKVTFLTQLTCAGGLPQVQHNEMCGSRG